MLVRHGTDEAGSKLTAGVPALIRASRFGMTGPGVLKASNPGLEVSPVPGWAGSRSRGSLDFWMCGTVISFRGLITGERDGVATYSRVRQDTELLFLAGSVLGIGFVRHD